MPDEYIELVSRLNLARQTWQVWGIGAGVSLDDLDDYEIAMLRLASG